MVRKFKRAQEFSSSDWIIFFQSWVLLLFVDLWLKTRSFRTLRDFLSKRQSNESRGKRKESQIISADIAHIGSIVETASRNHIIQMTCLRRALVLQWILSDRSVSTELKFGVKMADGKLLAHAWLEKDGYLINEPEILIDQFAQMVEINQQE